MNIPWFLFWLSDYDIGRHCLQETQQENLDKSAFPILLLCKINVIKWTLFKKNVFSSRWLFIDGAFGIIQHPVMYIFLNDHLCVPSCRFRCEGQVWRMSLTLNAELRLPTQGTLQGPPDVPGCVGQLWNNPSQSAPLARRHAGARGCAAGWPWRWLSVGTKRSHTHKCGHSSSTHQVELDSDLPNELFAFPEEGWVRSLPRGARRAEDTLVEIPSVLWTEAEGERFLWMAVCTRLWQCYDLGCLPTIHTLKS